MAMLEGKSVIIMGGTAGLGLIGGVGLCREERFLCLSVGTIRLWRKCKLEMPAAHVLVATPENPATADHAIREAVQRFGRLTGCTTWPAAAGGRPAMGRCIEITDQGWQATLELNLTSMFFPTAPPCGNFLNKERGAVLNMGPCSVFLLRRTSSHPRLRRRQVGDRRVLAERLVPPITRRKIFALT